MSKHSRQLCSFVYLALAVAMSQSSAFAADFPVGSYVAHKGITLTFDDKGQFRVLDGKTTQVTGNYRVKADQLELTDTGGPWACTKNGEQTGTYSWKYDHSVLTLTKVADLCNDRSGTLTPATWQAKSP